MSTIEELEYELRATKAELEIADGEIERLTRALTAAPPKPAPDAMRRLVEAAKPFAEIAPYVEFTSRRDGENVHLQRDPATGGWHYLRREHFRGIKSAYDAALSAPVPPADGARSFCLWLQDYFKRTAAYNKDELTTFQANTIRSTLNGVFESSPSPAVAAEPVAWRSRHGANSWSYHQVKLTGPSAHLFEQEPLYASPPIKGDRNKFYVILSHSIPSDMIDTIWQDLKEAGAVL